MILKVTNHTSDIYLMKHRSNTFLDVWSQNKELRLTQKKNNHQKCSMQ